MLELNCTIVRSLKHWSLITEIHSKHTKIIRCAIRTVPFKMYYRKTRFAHKNCFIFCVFVFYSTLAGRLNIGWLQKILLYFLVSAFNNLQTCEHHECSCINRLNRLTEINELNWTERTLVVCSFWTVRNFNKVGRMEQLTKLYAILSMLCSNRKPYTI